jgi:hypothetical protein
MTASSRINSHSPTFLQTDDAVLRGTKEMQTRIPSIHLCCGPPNRTYTSGLRQVQHTEPLGSPTPPPNATTTTTTQSCRSSHFWTPNKPVYTKRCGHHTGQHCDGSAIGFCSEPRTELGTLWSPTHTTETSGDLAFHINTSVTLNVLYENDDKTNTKCLSECSLRA